MNTSKELVRKLMNKPKSYFLEKYKRVVNPVEGKMYIGVDDEIVIGTFKNSSYLGHAELIDAWWCSFHNNSLINNAGWTITKHQDGSWGGNNSSGLLYEIKNALPECFKKVVK